MGRLDAVAASDLRLRLVVGPAVVALAGAVFAGVQLFGAWPGVAVGAGVGLALAGAVAYGMATRLF